MTAKKNSMQSTKFPGVRSRQHPTRKHGVKYDVQYFIRYTLNDMRPEEPIGWLSEGVNAETAFAKLTQIKQDIKDGKPIITLKERREKAARLRAEKEAAAADRAKRNVDFDSFFEGVYRKEREPKALVPEVPLYKYWIKPVIGDKKFAEIGELDMTSIKRNAVKAGKSLRTVEYCYSVVRMVFNMAATHGIYSGPHPVTKSVKAGIKYDNRKTYFLPPDKAQELLAALCVRSKQTHDMALLALYCGLRAGEVCGLDWSDVDMDNRMLTLRDTKSSRTRMVPMPEQVVEMFRNMEAGKGNVPVFVGANGGRLLKVSKTFPRTVVSLGFNDGVVDRRQKVTFHTLRHTFASWLVQAGIPLLTVQKLLGHSTIRMTERYSHLAPENFEKAADILSSINAEPAAEKVVNINGD